MALIDEVLLVDLDHNGDLVDAAGDLTAISGLENMKQAIIRRIMTKKGSLIHRPDYGCSLESLQNAPTTLATKERFVQELVNQFKNEPRVDKITQVSIINADGSPEKITIIVKVRLVGYDEVAVSIQPFGET
jgi:phage baseplate assembly protein W